MKHIRFGLLPWLLFVPALLFAAGASELNKLVPGTGLLLIPTRTLQTQQARWTSRVIFKNTSTGTEHSIDIAARSRNRFYRLPAGDYVLDSDIVLKDGVFDPGPDGNRFPRITFSLAEGEIAVLPFIIYYYDTKQQYPQSNGYPLPPEYRGFPEFRRSYSDSSIQTRFFTMNREFEEEILRALVEMNGIEEWSIAPRFAENDRLWPYRRQSLTTLTEQAAGEPESQNWEAPPLRLPDLNVIVVGIDQYLDAEIELRYAADSAKEIASLFEQWGKDRFATIESVVLTGTVLRPDLIASLESAIDSFADDSYLICYIAGHAVSDIKGRPFIVPSDGELSELQSTCIPLKAIAAALDDFRGTSLVLLDAGWAGEWTRGKETLFSMSARRLSAAVGESAGKLALLATNTGTFLSRDSRHFPQTLTRSLEFLSIDSLFDKRAWQSALGDTYPRLYWAQSNRMEAGIIATRERSAAQEADRRRLIDLVRTGRREDVYRQLDTMYRSGIWPDVYLKRVESELDLQFSVGDGIGIIASPSDKASGVPTDINEISIAFSEPMNGRVSITWQEGLGTHIVKDSNFWSEDFTRLTVPVRGKLQSFTEYYFILNPKTHRQSMGTSTGELIEQDTRITFTTGD